MAVVDRPEHGNDLSCGDLTRHPSAEDADAAVVLIEAFVRPSREQGVFVDALLPKRTRTHEIADGGVPRPSGALRRGRDDLRARARLRRRPSLGGKGDRQDDEQANQTVTRPKVHCFHVLVCQNRTRRLIVHVRAAQSLPRSTSRRFARSLPLRGCTGCRRRRPAGGLTGT
jgi:hypothetical protein